MGPVIMLLLVALVPVAAFFWMRSRVSGRMLCWIMEEDRSAKQTMLKVQGDFVVVDDERYVVTPEAVRLIRYPSGWPPWMQQIVPCSLYSRGNAAPIDWATSTPTHLSATELGSILDPNWMRLIVRGTKEGGTVGGTSRIITFATLGMAAVSIVMIFYLISQLGTLSGTVDVLQQRLGG
tara:strand:+ start:431 stop:967 length:537 start_codon:yes stop_codon:yes gene_type:complete